MKLRSTITTLIILFVISADQVIKVCVKTGMCLYDKIHITDWFYIFFTENMGMAFGMSFISTVWLTLFRLGAIAFFTYILIKQIRKQAPIGFLVCLSMIIAGAFGNIIDNSLYGLIFTESVPLPPPFAQPAQLVALGHGYGSFLNGRVVDMFYFPLFRWPDWMPLVGGNTFFGAVFNFADAAISCGAVAMILFYHKYLSLVLSSSKTSQEINDNTTSK